MDFLFQVIMTFVPLNAKLCLHYLMMKMIPLLLWLYPSEIYEDDGILSLSNEDAFDLQLKCWISMTANDCFEEGLDTIAEELKEMHFRTSDEPRITFIGTLLSLLMMKNLLW